MVLCTVLVTPLQEGCGSSGESSEEVYQDAAQKIAGIRFNEWLDKLLDCFC